MKKLRQLLFGIGRRFSEDKVTVYGAQASFFLMVSLGPFLIALAAMLQFFIPSDRLDTLKIYLNILPASIMNLINLGINDIFTTSAPSIISISVILALWSASKGLLSLERCLHAIYQINERRNYLFLRLRAVFYTIFFLTAIVFALGFLVFGNTIQSLLAGFFPILDRISTLIIALRALLSIVIFIFAFTIIYKMLSGARRKFIDILPGVLFSTVGWMIFSVLYAYYISNFSNYTVLYGTLGAMTLFMLWIYFCILILLIGAEFNIFLEDHHSFFRSSSTAKDS